MVRGTVTQLANFGAFARIEDGIEGLIHVSELADERVTHPKQVVKEGEDLLLRIIRIDPQRRRMGLSLRRALDTPDAELIGVFGEGIVEEKERIIQELRDALAIEGIELNLSGAPALDENGEAIVEAPADGSGGATEEQAARSAPVEATPRTFREEQPRVEKKERVRKERPATGVPSEIRDEPMSAMELAFAMAGAQADLEKEAADAEKGEEEE